MNPNRHLALRLSTAGRARQRGSAMIEGLLVLPLIMFMLSLAIYFGISMQRFQRTMMMDRYESWRGAARAPGPSAGTSADSSTLELRSTFFAGDDPTVGYDPTDYFPDEAMNDLRDAAAEIDTDAELILRQYAVNFPRGRSIRISVSDNSGIALWDRLFPGALRHRHTKMDTDWKFFNQVVEGNKWFDDRSGAWETLLDPRRRGAEAPSMPTLGPAQSVREAVYADFDRRLDAYAASNSLADRIQDFYTYYPNYFGPTLPILWTPQGWSR